jgi:hypothetical protein
MPTVIKSLVNMTSAPIFLSTPSIPTAAARRAEPFAVASTNWVVPACVSLDQVNSGFYLQLDFDLGPGFGWQAGSRISMHIWEQSDALRFMIANDLPKLSNGETRAPTYGFIADYDSKGFPDGDNAGKLARALANQRNGGEFRVSGNPEASLVLDERFWVIAYAIGR